MFAQFVSYVFDDDGFVLISTLDAVSKLQFLSY